jgi:hypothetical protein
MYASAPSWSRADSPVGSGRRQGETNDMKADGRERMEALGRQGGRSTGSSVSWRSNSTCCAAYSAFAQRFFCRSRNPCPGRWHSNFAWIETAFPATARVRCRAEKVPKLLPQSTAQLKGGPASQKTGVLADSIIPQAEFSGLLRPARGPSLFR